VCAEVALRVFMPQPTWSYLTEMLEKHYIASEYNTFELKKNYQGVEPSMERLGENVNVSINSSGFRGSKELVSEARKILVLGDSYTFGVYVSNEDTYPEALQNRIDKNFENFQVINAGYSGGFETDQQYVWLKKNISILNPEVVILGIFLGNDILGIKETAWRDLDALGLPSRWINNDIEVREDGILRSRLKGISTVGDRRLYQYPLLRDSHLVVLTSSAIGNIINRNGNMGDGIEMAPKGYIDERVDGFNHVYGFYSDQFLGREKLFLRILSGIKKVCHANNAKFIVALLPANFMVDKAMLNKVFPGNDKFTNLDSVYYSRLEKLLQNEGVEYINVENEMRRNLSAGPVCPKNGEVHFNANGNKFTGDVIYQKLDKLHWLR
jgi:hypothetical protein